MEDPPAASTVPGRGVVQTDRPRFGKEYLDKHRSLWRAPLAVHLWPERVQGGGGLQVFDLPRPRQRYCVEADVAGRVACGTQRIGELLCRVARVYKGNYGITGTITNQRPCWLAGGWECGRSTRSGRC